MIYKAFTLSTVTALASVLPSGVALANDDVSIPIFGETTIGDITAKVTSGITLEDDSLGAFSDFYSNEITTIDFNSPATQVGENSYTFGNKITYTFGKSISTASGDATGVYKSGIYSDRWAPTGANGEKNTSNYLAVFRGNPVTIDLAADLDYFGVNWGALSEGNNLTFLNNGTEINTFTYRDIEPITPIKAIHQANQGNGYVHFYTDSSFNQIVLSQTQPSGFETDNHSFRFGSVSEKEQPESVPEPAAVIGLVAAGALMTRCKFTRPA
ncbi:MAG: PEP-CTERM sorting domain-containing protein [Cyanobacteria bacterium P01_H01_bin.21]